MHIRPSLPQNLLPGSSLSRNQPPHKPEETFRPSPKNEESSFLKRAATLTTLALPVATGIYAGLSSGTLAAVAGAFAATPGAAALGALAGALIAEKVLGTSEAGTVGATLFGGVVGAGAGLAGGAYLGAAATSPWAAAGLGALGCVSAGLIYLNQRAR
jgi:hypothetical protein